MDKLFGKYSLENITIKDLSIAQTVSLSPLLVPHTFGRHAKKGLGKTQVNVVERLANRVPLLDGLRLRIEAREHHRQRATKFHVGLHGSLKFRAVFRLAPFRTARFSFAMIRSAAYGEVSRSRALVSSPS